MFHLFHFWTWKILYSLCVCRLTSFEDRLPPETSSNEIKTQCKLCCSLLHLLHTKGHTHTHSGHRSCKESSKEKKNIKNYHNQLAHVKQVVPKSYVCVSVCHLHTLDVYVIFFVFFIFSTFIFMTTTIWHTMKKKKKKQAKKDLRKMYYNNYRDFCSSIKPHRCVACAVPTIQQFSGICLFIWYGMVWYSIWHAQQFIFHLWQVQLQLQGQTTTYEWRKREFKKKNTFQQVLPTDRGIYR